VDDEVIEEAQGVAPAARDPIMQRIVSVLEACARTRKPVTVTYLVEATGLAKSTVHRMCWKLEQLGMLDHTDDGFSIGTKLFTLANANPVVTRIRASAIPHLVALQQVAGASHLAILTGGRALVVDGLYTKNLRAHALIGVGLPLHCTAVGKALLSKVDIDERERLLGRGVLPAATSRSVVQPGTIRRQLERVAEQGYAVSNEEFQLGVVSVASPFTVAGGGVVAAVACIGSSTDPRVRRSIPRVVDAARQLQAFFDERQLLATRIPR
jgi:DNA-binding IclR family transcriptional regulator